MRKPVIHSIWLVLVLSILSSSVRAGTIGDLTYMIADGQVYISDCSQSAEGELVIPAEIEGLPVTLIGYQAFEGCSSLTSMTIPESVTSIGYAAFAGCRGLTSITFPDSVTSIGDSAFNKCSSLTSITIPDGVTSIGDRAFSGCTSLTSITIPDSVTSIGGAAFWNCSSLTSITIPNKFHSRLDANRLSIGDLYPGNFFPYPSPRRAKATPVLTNGFLTELLITDLGARYTEAPAVTIIGGGGSGAEAVAVMEDWHVVSIEIINAGRGYTSEPTVLIDYPVEVPPTSVIIRMVPAITVTGEFGQTETIEVADTADGPWTEWRTVIIGEEGTTEVDLDEGAEKRFYRVRD